MGKAHLDMYRNMGANRVTLPGENATAEELTAFNHTIGVPKDAKDYGTFEYEGIKPDAGMDAFAREWFPKAGITKRGADLLVPAWNKMVTTTIERARADQAQKIADGEAAFAKKMGAGHAAAIDLANRAANQLGLAGDKMTALKGAIGADEALSLLHRLGNVLASDGEDPHGDRGSLSITTKDQAQAELDRMNGDARIRNIILNEPNHPEYKALKAKWSRLVDQAAG